MTETQTIPWVRIGAESAAIIASILLAFGIDAWWDERADRALEQEYLVSLRVEVERGLAELEGDVTRRHELSTTIARFLREGELDEDEFYEMMERATVFLNAAPPTSVMDDLVSSGRLQLIQSTEIREGIMLFRQQMQKNELNDQPHRTFVNTRLVPFLSDTVSLTGLVRAAPVAELDMPLLSEAELADLQADQRFRNIMIERRQHLVRGLVMLEATTQHLQSRLKLLSQALE